MHELKFQGNAFDELVEWGLTNRTVFGRLTKCIRDAQRDPFKGIGKPELLKHEYQGCWSRRITQEHRLIYRVSETTITVISCKAHYND
jgi:toxin YoeB